MMDTLLNPEKRGKEGINEIEIFPDFKWIIVHDFWNPYLSYSFSS